MRSRDQAPATEGERTAYWRRAAAIPQYERHCRVGGIMTELRSILASVFVLALPVVLGGCPVAIVGGLAAAGGAGYEAGAERGVQGSIDDFSIKSNIQQALQQTDPYYPVLFDVTVYDGRVLL